MSAARVSQLLEVCDRLPADLGRWLAAGLQAWQQGADLETALQLDVPALDLDQRDQLLRGVAALYPGESDDDKAAFLAGLLSDGYRKHPDPSGERLLRILRASRCRLPGSIKQLRRIVRGYRSEGWRQGTELPLCPEEDAGQDGVEQFFGANNGRVRTSGANRAS